MIPTLKAGMVAPVTFAQSLRDVVRNALDAKIDRAVGITGLSKTVVKTETIEAILRVRLGHYGDEDATAPRSAAYVDIYEAQAEAPIDGLSPAEVSALNRFERSDPPASDASPESFEGTPAFETPVSIRNMVGPEGVAGLRPDARLEAVVRKTAGTSPTLVQREQGIADATSSQVFRPARAGHRCVRCGRIRTRPHCGCPTR